MNLQIVQIYKKNAIQASFFCPFLSGFPSIALPLENSVEGV